MADQLARQLGLRSRNRGSRWTEGSVVDPTRSAPVPITIWYVMTEDGPQAVARLYGHGWSALTTRYLDGQLKSRPCPHSRGTAHTQEEMRP